MSPEEQLDRYRQVMGLTLKMRELADAEKWDQFMQAEADRRTVLASLEQEKIGNNEELRTIVRNILDLDREIVQKVQLWMDELRSILTQMSTVQRLNKAYLKR